MSPSSPRRPVASLLLHPYFLLALAVLVANDHWWKYRWPGFVTGKLSDFAGPVVVAFAVTAITGRRRVSVIGTAVGFAALKVSPPIAIIAAPILGGVTRSDPTDLVGLFALVPAWLLLGRVPGLDPGSGLAPPVATAIPSRTTPAGHHRAASLAERAKTATLVVVTPITVFSVTATSCEQSSAAFLGLFEAETGVVAQLGDDRGEPFGYYLSANGGTEWEVVDPDNIPGAGGGLDLAAIRVGELIAETEVCLDDGRCFRAVEGERIEVRNEGDWETSFSFTDEQVERMEARSDGCSGTGRVDRLYAALLVTSTDGPAGETAAPDGSNRADAADPTGGQTVLATMGPQGVLRLDPVSGEWERIAVGTYEPISHFGPRWLLQLIFSPFAALFATPLLLLVNRGRNVSGNRRAVAVIINILGSLGLFGFALFLLLLSFGTIDYAWLGLTTLAVTILVFVVALTVVLPAGQPTPSPGPAGPGRGPGPPPGAWPRGPSPPPSAG